MKLYAVIFRHHSPKDRETGIKEFVLVPDEAAFLAYFLKEHLRLGGWDEDCAYQADAAHCVEILAADKDEDAACSVHAHAWTRGEWGYEEEGTHSLRECILAASKTADPTSHYDCHNGEYADTYYGLTIWGFREVAPEVLTPETLEVLRAVLGCPGADYIIVPPLHQWRGVAKDGDVPRHQACGNCGTKRDNNDRETCIPRKAA